MGQNGGNSEGETVMQLMTKTLVALSFVGTMAVAVPVETHAQGIYFQGPGVEFGIGRPAYRERYYNDYYAYDRPYVYRDRSYYYDRDGYEGRRYRSYRWGWD
jgi:hypothetical protein